MNAVRSAATSLWALPATTSPPPRGRRDRALAAVVLAGVAAEAVLRDDLVWRPVAIGFGCGLAITVLLRRANPLAAVVFGFGGFAVLDLATSAAGADPVFLYSGAAVLLLAYSLLRWGRGRDAVLGLAVMAAALVTSTSTDLAGAGDVIGGAAVLLFAAAAGVAMRYRDAARAQLVEQARLREREQLARELHDTVAHHVSAIAVQAQAGLFLARSGSAGGATDALEVIEREAARTLAEMRTMVGALRDHRARPEVAPHRGLADIEALATDHRHDVDGANAMNNPDGPRVDVELRGDLADLPPAVEAALYRVAQEGVTNAQRHAHQASRVQVTVVGSARDVTLSVRDDGSRAAAPAGPVGTVGPTGYGLVGMNERVTLLGGTLVAGPDHDRGWRVHAVLPRRTGAT